VTVTCKNYWPPFSVADELVQYILWAMVFGGYP
jgi:hypothetical protein